MKKTFRIIILLVLLVCVSCATKETVKETEKAVETVQAEPWLYPSVKNISASQWDELFKATEEEKPQETTEIPPVEEPIEEVVEKPVEEAVEAIEETVEEVVESVKEESAVKILAEEEEKPVVQEEEQIELPEMEWNFAGEDYRDLSWVLEEEPAVATTELQGIEKSTTTEQGQWVEEMNPDLITEMAKEYKALEEQDMVQPTFKEKVLAFVKQNLLYIEIAGLVIIFAIVLKVLVSRAKKRHEGALEKPVEDEGEEVDMTPSYYVSPNVVPQSYKDEIGDEVEDTKMPTKEKSENATNENKGSKEVDAEENYDDGF